MSGAIKVLFEVADLVLDKAADDAGETAADEAAAAAEASAAGDAAAAGEARGTAAQWSTLQAQATAAGVSLDGLETAVLASIDQKSYEDAIQETIIAFAAAVIVVALFPEAAAAASVGWVERSVTHHFFCYNENTSLSNRPIHIQLNAPTTFVSRIDGFRSRFAPRCTHPSIKKHRMGGAKRNPSLFMPQIVTVYYFVTLTH